MKFAPLILMVGLGVPVGVAAAQSAPTSPAPSSIPSASGTSAPDAAPLASPAHAAVKVVPAELAAIEEKLETRQYDAARAPLLQFLAGHPDDARARFDLGYIDDETSQPDAAAAEYRKAIAADPTQFESRLALGLYLARNGDLKGAQEQLRAATVLEPATPNPAAQAQAYRALAQIDLKFDPPAAKEALLGALRLSPETAGDLLLTARIALANDDEASAEAAYRRYIARQPDSVEGLAGLAHILVQEKKYEDAAPLLESALQKIPDDPGLNMQMASLLAAEGKQSESVAYLEKLHAKQPGDLQIDRMLADAYLAARSAQQAEPLLSAILKAEPDNVDILDEEGQALISGQKFDEAAKVFQHATELKADDADAWGGLAFADSHQRKDAEALRALTMRQKLQPDSASTLFLWAISYDNLHQRKAAAGYYRKFLDAANGHFPDQEWQAKHRLVALSQVH